ncbi:MAG: serine/threonine-protein kinase [Planctomycetia bacterium]|jgi:serine/threonine protein kinase
MDHKPTIPDFEILHQIGSGAFGHVWLARNRTTSALRAIKVITTEAGSNQKTASREISSLTYLEENLQAKHPNLAEIFHVGRTDSHLFYVMEPADNLSGQPITVDGPYSPATLESRLAFGPLESEEAMQFAEELLAALVCLHESGMVHRDVKPSNCLIVGGRIKLADFGLLTPSSPLLSCVGTRQYMPPDGQMDAQADVYAAGLVIYEMITGLPAERYPSSGLRGKSFTSDRRLAILNRLVLTACSPNRSERFSSAKAMLDALHKMQAALAEKPASSLKQKETGRWKWSLTGVAAVLIVLGVWGLYENNWFRTPVSPVSESIIVNFISDPPEATVLINGEQILQTEGAKKGQPFRTPCSIPNLKPKTYEVTFVPDPADTSFHQTLLGEIDFSKIREVEAALASDDAE